MNKIKALMYSTTIIVPDLDESDELFREFYGKPAGYDKPKPGEARGPLILDPLEAVYLLELGKLEVYRSSGDPVNYEELVEWARKRIPRFDMLYPVYKDLRNRGFVVRSGLKYGSDFTVYRHGPGIDHSPYIVHSYPGKYTIDPVEIVKAGRLSHTVRKTFILSITGGESYVVYLMFKWFKP